MTSTLDLCTRAERLCRALAPIDLAATPVYVVAQTQLPGEFEVPKGCDGYTAPCLDLYLQLSTLAPRWRGRGACLVVNDADQSLPGDEFLGIVLHELAHVLNRPRPYRERPEPPDHPRIAWERMVLAESVCTDPPPPPPGAGRIARCAGHESPFIRLVMHLCHRIGDLGYEVLPGQAYSGWLYRLSTAAQYAEALGDEPARLAASSFREILALPASEAFEQLWAADMARLAG